MKHHLTLLAVDDNQLDLDLLRDSLNEIQDFDFQLLEATTWKEALLKLQSTPIDIILVDYRLNGKNGLDVMAMMRGDGITQPIVIITGQDDEQLALESLKAGAADFLLKGTLTPAGISRTLQNIVQREALSQAIKIQERREKEISASHRQLLNLVENLPAGAIYVVGENIKINKMVEQITGYRQNEVDTQDKWYRVLYGDEAELHRSRFLNDKKNGNAKVYRVPIRHKNGSTRIVEFIAHQIEDVEIWLMLDKTEEVRANEERERLEKRVHELKKLEGMGTLAGGIAHDYNNLLNIIQGNADYALECLQSPEEIESSLDEIKQAAKRAIDLTQHLLHFSGQGKFQATEIEPAKVLTQFQLSLENIVPPTITVHFQTPETLPPIKGDSAQLRHALHCIAINSIESIGNNPGTIRIQAKIEQGTPPENEENILFNPNVEYLVIGIIDTGTGIDVDHTSRVFDPYFSTKGSGRGLGLAAVQGIVRAHNGFCKIDTQLEKGTTFRIYLPLEKSYQTDSTGESNVHESEEHWQIAQRGEPMTTVKTILVIDDEPGIRRLAQKILERAGHHVLLAEDGAQGVELYRSQVDQIDGLLIDMSMPGFNGLETLRRIREINSNAKAVMSSGYSEENLTEQDDADFILKPYTPKDLVAIINKMLGTN